MKKAADRAMEIILSPASTWDEIKAEQTAEKTLIKEYYIFIAAVPAIAGFIGLIFKGENLFISLLWSALFVGFAIGGSLLMAKAMNFFAINFSAEQKTGTYFRLVSYSLTPVFLANIFFLIPPLYGLSIIGIYGFYVFWVGFSNMVTCAKDEKTNFFFVAFIVFILILILIYLLPALISGTAVYYSVV